MAIVVAHGLVLSAGRDDAVALAPLDVDHDVAERPVGERARALEVHDAVVLQLVAALAQAAQPLLHACAQVEREATPERKRARRGHALQLSAAHQLRRARVLQHALIGEPGVEVDDAVERPAAMVGDEHDVAAECARQGAHGLVEDLVDTGQRARLAAALPLVPAEVVGVVGRHEHDHEQLGVEALRQPEGELDALLGDTPHGVEVDAARGRDGERVILHQRAEAPLELLEQARRRREALAPAVGVEAGERESVDVVHRPREGHVDHAHAAPGGAQALPDGGLAAIGTVDRAQAVAALVALVEIPDAVPAGAHAREHRRPGLGRERVRGRAQHTRGALSEQAIEVGNRAGRTQRLQHQRRHRVQADDSEGGRSHASKLSQAVSAPPSPTGWGLAGRTPVQTAHSPPVAWPESA